MFSRIVTAVPACSARSADHRGSARSYCGDSQTRRTAIGPRKLSKAAGRDTAWLQLLGKSCSSDPARRPWRQTPTKAVGSLHSGADTCQWPHGPILSGRCYDCPRGELRRLSSEDRHAARFIPHLRDAAMLLQCAFGLRPNRQVVRPRLALGVVCQIGRMRSAALPTCDAIDPVVGTSRCRAGELPTPHHQLKYPAFGSPFGSRPVGWVRLSSVPPLDGI